MTAADSQTGGEGAPSMVRALIRRIIDGVAAGQKYHLRVAFSDHTTHDTTHPAWRAPSSSWTSMA